MWQLINLATVIATLLLALYAVRSISDFRVLFVLVAIWARYALSSFDEYTASSVVAGFSINALYSVAVACVGLLLVPIRVYAKTVHYAVPFLALFFIIILSGAANAEYVGLFKNIMKWLYFVAILLLLYRAFELHDRDAVLRGLFCVSLTPLALQFMSILVGEGSFDPTIEAIVYIGGYDGSAAFTVGLFTTLCVGALINWRYSVVGLGIAAMCVAGIYIAQYRTTILAALPLIGVLGAVVVMRWTPLVLRPLTFLYVLVGGVCLVALGIAFMPPKFLDIVVVLQSVEQLMKRPEFYTDAERDLFSGRIFIWAQYLSTWLDGSTLVHVIGYGPEAWENSQAKYAHNTFVSYLYEFGIVGLAMLIVLLFWQLLIAANVQPASLAVRLTAALLGFMIANLATMPLWLIEGLILLAFLCALSWAASDAAGRSAPSAVSAPSAPRQPIGTRWAAARVNDGLPRRAARRLG